MERDAQFQKHLLETFRVEAEEHLKGITAGLLALEKGGSAQRQAETIESVFREAHSLKGAARSVGLAEIEALCQAMESLFAALKRQELSPSAPLCDLLQRAADLLERLLARGGEAGEGEKSAQRELVKALLSAAKPPPTTTAGAPVEAPVPPAAGDEPAERAEEIAAAPAPPPPEPAPERAPLPEARAPQAAAETVRVSWAKLSSVLLLSEEMLSAKLATRQHALQMRGLRALFADWRKQWNKLAPGLPRLGQSGASEEEARELSRVQEFLAWNCAFLKSLELSCAAHSKHAEQDSRFLGGMVDHLLEEVKKAMMFPFSSLLEAFPKMVRDLSRNNGKEAELVIRGEEIEIDRRILEEMKDPLIHLLRNCLDHGIESPGVREAAHKPRRGRVAIEIASRDDKAEIVVADDGAGIAPGQLREAVAKLGTFPADRLQALSDAELLPFVFQSGLSTSPIITEVSGHGLGLAIVREKVEKLGGTVSLESLPGRGTTFRLLLPLSVATFRGVLVRVADRIFVFPATHVERVLRLRREEIRTVEGRRTVALGEEALALESLATPLELSLPVAASLDQPQAVLVSAGDQRIAFAVDEVLGEQEVLLKSLGPQLSRVRNIAGATVLGSGRVAPILNVPDLIKSAARPGARTSLSPPATGDEAARQRLLVVEDSITSRTLLKNILETAGYQVSTAVDGVDAFTQLKSGEFDMVVSDVDMPRMNGFELTSRIRRDAALHELPVVLVTALGSREDRERGIDAGANAYLVKSSFDQSNLLQVVKRLI
jgi:two-component system chemotaxis sensor kinase CheA